MIRLTVSEAAALLGISEGAVRKRLARSTLEHERDNDGRVWVFLDAATYQEPTGQRTGQPGGQDARQSELVEELRDRVRSLEESNREMRRLLAGMIERMPQLEAPQESHHDSPSEPDQESQEHNPPNPQERVKRSWWQRLSGR